MWTDSLGLFTPRFCELGCGLKDQVARALTQCFANRERYLRTLTRPLPVNIRLCNSKKHLQTNAVDISSYLHSNHSVHRAAQTHPIPVDWFPRVSRLRVASDTTSYLA